MYRRGTLSRSKYFIYFYLDAKSPKQRKKFKRDWMIIVYKVLQNISLDVPFVLYVMLVYSFTSYSKACCIEISYFDTVNFCNMFSITGNALRFKIVMICVGHSAEVTRSIMIIKASEVGQIIFNETVLFHFLLIINYRLRNSGRSEVWTFIPLGNFCSP